MVALARAKSDMRDVQRQLFFQFPEPFYDVLGCRISQPVGTVFAANVEEKVVIQH
jgi:hypothetical protein